MAAIDAEHVAANGIVPEYLIPRPKAKIVNSMIAITASDTKIAYKEYLIADTSLLRSSDP